MQMHSRGKGRYSLALPTHHHAISGCSIWYIVGIMAAVTMVLLQVKHPEWGSLVAG
jgi:hypothetical protein